MTDMNDLTLAGIQEYTVLSKYEGEAHPDNLIEQVHIENGEVVKLEKFDNGELISSEEMEGGVYNPDN
jgi:hypothetical protein